MTPAKAYQTVRTAIKRGTLTPPDRCSKCGKKQQPASDGRRKIHAHHHDYSKPLDVEWLCAKCHRAETPLPVVMGGACYGERNGQAKLTAELAETIRKSKKTGPQIAREMGIHRSTVNRIRSGLYWRRTVK